MQTYTDWRAGCVGRLGGGAEVVGLCRFGMDWVKVEGWCMQVDEEGMWWRSMVHVIGMPRFRRVDRKQRGDVSIEANSESKDEL